MNLKDKILKANTTKETVVEEIEPYIVEEPKQAEKLVELVPKIDDEISNIVDEAIEEINNPIKEEETKKDDFIELLKSTHIENIEATTKIIQTANNVIKEKSNLASMVMVLTKDVIKLMKRNHTLEDRQNKLALKWMGLGAVVGGVLVYLFPEYLPYVKDAWNYLRGGD